MASSNMAASGIIVPSATYLGDLEAFVCPASTLKQAGYVTQQLTDQQLDAKKRCIDCGIRRNKVLAFA
jgi:hypothetical protein